MKVLCFFKHHNVSASMVNQLLLLSLTITYKNMTSYVSYGVTADIFAVQNLTVKIEHGHTFTYISWISLIANASLAADTSGHLHLSHFKCGKLLL